MVGYTVKEVARELNISEQAIYKKYREIEDLKKFIIKENGIKLLTKDGLVYLKNYKSRRGIKESLTKLNQEQQESLKLKSLKSELEEKTEFKVIIDTLEYFKEENKRLLGIIEEQNSLIDNQIEVVKREQQITLNHTELLLVEKREILKLRAEQYQKEKEEQKKWYKKLFK